MVPSPEGISPMNKNNCDSPSRRKTILDAILDVIACVSQGNAPPHARRNGCSSSSSSLASASVTGGSPSNSKNARTKSARRKLKQHQQLGPQDGELSLSGNSWWSQRNVRSIPELSQTLSVMVYFISLDCTLSKDHSVAAMGATLKPALARTIRSIFIHHSKALRGILQLCLHRERSKPSRSTNNSTVAKKLHRIPSSVASSSVSFTSSSALGSAQSNLSLSGGSTLEHGHRRRLIVRRKPSEVSSSLSSPEYSQSSQPFIGDETMASAATPKSSGDPTKAGRLKRRHRRPFRTTGDDDDIMDKKLPAVPEGGDLDELDWHLDTSTIPSPKKRTKPNQYNIPKSSPSDEKATMESTESSSFSEPASPTRNHAKSFMHPSSPGDQSVASSVVSVESTNSLVNARTAQRLNQLKSRVHFTSSLTEKTAATLQEEDCSEVLMDYADPWVCLVCLESLNRVIGGKEGDGTSCLNEEPNDDDSSPEDEETNPLLQTNRRIGNSGIIPLLSKCMSQGLDEGLLNHRRPYRQNWSERMSVLASLIDNACLFNKSNRRSFAEHFDPFSFEDDPVHNLRGESLIFHILRFLDGTLARKVMNIDSSDDAVTTTVVRLLALRTLTSLTHENDLAAEQMTVLHSFGDRENSIDVDHAGSKGTRGVDILAKLTFELEDRSVVETDKHARAKRRGEMDHESHRYDSTIFCLNTLSNIIEGPGVRRLLTDVRVITKTGQNILWIRWLCQWLVEQTSGFREAILSIGKKRGSQESHRELQQNEDDKLVAAGNGCVLLACLMTEPQEQLGDSGDETTTAIRKLIMEEMPSDKNGKPTGAALIINTLKAFCNFYHFSLGELSVAIVEPVKKLIDKLSELK